MNIYKIAGWVGVAIAIVSLFVTVPYGAPLMAIAGAVVGYSVAAEHNVRVIVSAVAFGALAHTFDGIPAVGIYIGGFIANIGVVVAGAAILIILRNMINRLMP